MLRPLTLLILLLLSAPAWCGETPKVFQKLDFASALARAKEQKQWLLVDATAVWCPPCHKMDATTWVDPALVAYLEKNAVAIQIDVDDQDELARELQIKAMPTVILFGPDGEIDRSVGYKTSSELLAWFDDLGQGKSQADRLREKAASGDIESSYDLAGHLLESGKLEEAEKLYLELWEKMRDSEWSGVRYSYLLDSLEELIQQRPSAKESLEKLRQETVAKDDMTDWFYLSRTLGHRDELLAWEPSRPISPRIETTYFDYLVEEGRLAKAGSLIEDPAASAQLRLERRDSLIKGSDNDETGQQIRNYARESARDYLRNLYAACLAAGRAEEAQEVRRLASEDDPELAPDFERLDSESKP